MPILRNSDQKSMTLEEFYIDLSKTSSQSYADAGKGMLRFIELVNHMFKDTLLWGLTSVARLVIQNVDDWKAEWFVVIGNIGEVYYFEYLIPEDKQPWPNATIRGEAKSLAEAERYLLIAMKECGGWVENDELKGLLATHGL